jgi:methionyl-tRNA formyltransferase
VRVIFMGSPAFSVPALKSLFLAGYEVAAAYTQPDKPGGRGRNLLASPVKVAADRLGLTVVQPVSLKEAEAVEKLRAFSPDVIVVAAFGQILPKKVLGIPKFGCVNIHPSLLPRFRGALPVASVILSGEEFTGVSLMLMDEGLDTGPVLSQAMIPISASDTTASLGEKLSLVSAGLLIEVLPRYLKGEISPRPQDKAKATYSGVITKEAGEVDWQLPAIDIWRRVRAYQPWPGSYTGWGRKRLKILEAVPLPRGRSSKIGRVVRLDAESGKAPAAFGVVTGDGVLGVVRVQLEGKRAMTSAEFLPGQPGFIGSVLAL